MNEQEIIAMMMEQIFKFGRETEMDTQRAESKAFKRGQMAEARRNNDTKRILELNGGIK